MSLFSVNGDLFFNKLFVHACIFFNQLFIYFQVQKILNKFMKGNSVGQRALCERMKVIRQTFESSKYFMSHEVSN